jgi:type I restriction enzyme S subunit
MVQSGGTPKAGFTESAGVPFLKVYNIVDQQIAFDYRPQYVPRTTHEKELRKSRTLPGDVLMNIVGPPLGKVAVVPDTYPEWNINQAITLFRPGAEVSTQWIYTVLCSGKNVADVIHQTRGSVGQVNISLSQCRNFEIPIPSLAEQAEILRRLGELFVLADSLQRRYQDTVTCVEKLTPSVLKKAFRGGLVPQDPNDEPAGVMLKRVRAAVSADQTPTTTKTRAAAGRRG